MALTLDGSSGTTGNLANGDLQVNGVTVGKGGGTISTNTAVGNGALNGNTTGANNVAVGYQAGYTQTTGGSGGGYSVFIGQAAGYNSNGGFNVAVGTQAGYNLTTGVGNTFVGSGRTGVTLPSGYYVTTGNSNTIIGNYTGNADGLDIRTSSNYAIVSDGDGNRLLSTANGYSLALDGGAVPQSGTGITFPATQSASSDANTLDDYEEGTWTPTVLGATNPTVTYHGNNGGRYIKIGKMVYLQCYLRWTALSGGSGNMVIGGLPYTTANSTQAIGLSGVTEWSGSFPTNATYPTPTLESGVNQTFLYVLRNGPGTSAINMAISALANADTYLLFGFCYESST
jgi:hypothetical protein